MDSDAAYSARQRARHVPILLRCDVAGEARAVVARDLNLSPRQFARERRAAMECFTRHAAAITRRCAAAPVRTDLGEIQRERAARAADVGDRASALSLYLHLAHNAADPELRCRALLGAADVEMGEYDIARSVSYLQDVARLMATVPTASETRTRLGCWVRASLLRASIVTGEPVITDIARPIGGRTPAKLDDVDLLLSIAEAALDKGEAWKSYRYARRAREIIARGPPASGTSAIDLLALEGALASWVDGNFEKAASLCREAANLANTTGYAGRSMGLTYVADAFAWRAGDKFARTRCRAMIDAFQRGKVAMQKNLLFATLHCATDFETVVGDPWRAVAIGSQALAVGGPSATERLYIKSLISRAFARGGRIAVARRTAEDVLRRGQSSVSGRSLLNAMQALADASIAGRNRREAQEHLRSAADLAGRFGSAPALARIYRKLASVTRTQSDRRKADELARAAGRAQ